MNYVIAVLSQSPILLIFSVIGIGYLVGNIRVLGFSLGPAAVLFVGLFFGALDSRLRIPELIYVIGLILFVYTVGLQSGASFFSSFGRRSLRANAFAASAVMVAALASVIAGELMRLGGDSIVGVFCGSLTNTPALAACVEAIRNEAQRAGSASALHLNPDASVVAYGVSYPFGVIGVLIGFYLFERAWKRSRKGGETDHTAQEQAAGPLAARTFRVVNPRAIGKPVSRILAETTGAGFVLSRVRRGDVNTLAYPDTILEEGDLVVAVGDAAALDRALDLFGENSPTEIHVENREFDVRRIEVSDKRVGGKTLASLNLQNMLDATVTRVRRGDTDFVPGNETVLERGDRVRVVTWAGNMDRVAKFFGDSIRSSSETDFLSLSVGLLIGVFLGMVPVPLPGGGKFMLGFAGGPLIAGLVLGRLQKTGPLIWGMPFSANLTLRQVGLVFFLAGIGTKAGDGLVPALASGGWKMMLLGAGITGTVTFTVLFFGVRLLGISTAGVMGVMSGIQTQPACLAYANERAGSNAPNVWYASVYPLSMIVKILLAQCMVWWLTP